MSNPQLKKGPMTRPKPCTMACEAVILCRVSLVLDSLNLRDENRAGIKNNIVFASPVQTSARAMIINPVIIIGLRPYLSAICPVGTFKINIASAGAEITSPFADCDNPID